MTARALALAVAAVAIACGRHDRVVPPELHLGEQACAACAMAVSDARLAAAAIVGDDRGRVRQLLFDDPGCLALHLARSSERLIATYVRDYERDAWLDAASARFVRSPEIPTPMRYGIAGFGDAARAEAASGDRAGESFDFQGLISRAARGEVVPFGAPR